MIEAISNTDRDEEYDYDKDNYWNYIPVLRDPTEEELDAIRETASSG